MADPRRLDIAADLLDLQILDRDGKAVGRVDDLEFDDAKKPECVAILMGGAALANRFHGRFRLWIASIYRRLHDDRDPEPVRIDFAQVRHINSRVDLAVTADEVGVGRFEKWADECVIGRIAGADHAPQ